MITQCSYKGKWQYAMALLATTAFLIGLSGTAAAGPNDKCATAQTLTFAPGSTVPDGTLVTVTQEVKTTSLGTGNGVCGLAIGSYVNDGNAQLKGVELDGDPRPCADVGLSYCTAGLTGDTCTSDEECDSVFEAGDGVCTAVTSTTLVTENPSDGSQSAAVDTTGLGGSVLGFEAQYTGGGNFANPSSPPKICSDLTVEEEECSGATIGIDRASGPGEPTVPGGPYSWTFRVTIHACEDLEDVSAQGGTNGWAQLSPRTTAALHPSFGSAAIRKANNKTDVILWTIGSMTAGQTETLVVDLSGSIKGAPDCQERFLSGPWSALFSTDGVTIEKSDYTGRVSIFTNSNGTTGDCP